MRARAGGRSSGPLARAHVRTARRDASRLAGCGRNAYRMHARSYITLHLHTIILASHACSVPCAWAADEAHCTVDMIVFNMI